MDKVFEYPYKKIVTETYLAKTKPTKKLSSLEKEFSSLFKSGIGKHVGPKGSIEVEANAVPKYYNSSHYLMP